MEGTITFDISKQEDGGWNFEVYSSEEEWFYHKVFLDGCKPREKPFNEPARFPCLAIKTGMHTNSVSPYMVHYAFIYDFQHATTL